LRPGSAHAMHHRLPSVCMSQLIKIVRRLGEGQALADNLVALFERSRPEVSGGEARTALGRFSGITAGYRHFTCLLQERDAGVEVVDSDQQVAQSATGCRNEPVIL